MTTIDLATRKRNAGHLLGLVRLLGDSSTQAHTHTWGRLHGVITPTHPDEPRFNIATPDTTGTLSDFAACLVYAENDFRNAGITTWGVIMPDEHHQPGAAAHLISKGYSPTAHYQLMTRALTTRVPRPADPAVIDSGTPSDHAALLERAMGSASPMWRTVLTSEPAGRPAFTYYAALNQATTVAAAITYEMHNPQYPPNLAIYLDIAVAPGHINGQWLTMMRTALHDGQAHGCTTATVLAPIAQLATYHQLGFTGGASASLYAHSATAPKLTPRKPARRMSITTLRAPLLSAVPPGDPKPPRPSAPDATGDAD